MSTPSRMCQMLPCQPPSCAATVQSLDVPPSCPSVAILFQGCGIKLRAIVGGGISDQTILSYFISKHRCFSNHYTTLLQCTVPLAHSISMLYTFSSSILELSLILTPMSTSTFCSLENQVSALETFTKLTNTDTVRKA